MSVAGPQPYAALEAGAAVNLMKGFCQDWLNRADPAACEAIMHSDYEVHIGGIVLSGLQEYVPATLGQLQDFRGLAITVHELFTNGSEIALRFTEHGASLRAGGNAAAWRGIALFWTDGSLLVRNVTEEDYASRRRQLTAGVSDSVGEPAVAPWSTQPAAADLEAETRVRTWLEAGGLSGTGRGGLVFDNGVDAGPILTVDSTTVLDLFSAGESVGFHVLEYGGYREGLELPEALVGSPCSLSTVGMVRVGQDGRISGHLVRDRAGLRRSLSRA